jgi:hypothetical protein
MPNSLADDTPRLPQPSGVIISSSPLGAADTLSVEVTRSPAGLASGDLRSAKRLFDVSVFEQTTKSAGWYR